MQQHESGSSSIKKVSTSTAAKKGLGVIGGIAVVTGRVFFGDKSASHDAALYRAKGSDCNRVEICD
ncbi:MAG: hypothetical protein DMG75_05130 [Acidobacteria bacterium]|nr:MAG: hypothetical protein DMG75_05130 [Acidobacteriota bacterium]